MPLIENNISISDTTDLNISEKVDILFKNYLGFTSTDETKPYYDEGETFNNYVIGDELLIDSIPASPVFINKGVYNDISASQFTIYSKLIKDISLSTLIDDISRNHKETYDRFTNNSIQKFDNEEGLQVVLKFNRLKLTRLSGLNDSNANIAGFNALYSTTDPRYTDSSYVNLLEDTIQFNYNKTNISAPYQWNIEYYNGSKFVDVTPTHGSNIFDIKSGIISFFDWDVTAFNSDLNYNNDISLDHISDNLYITFVKYIGRKGITNLQKRLDTNILTVNELTVNDAATINGTLDVCNNVTLRGEILDISGHTTIRNGLDVRDNVTLQSVLNVGESVTLRGSILDISGHTTIRNGLDVTDNVTLQSVLDVSDNVTLRGSILDIEGFTTIRNGLHVEDHIVVKKYIAFGDISGDIDSDTRGGTIHSTGASKMVIDPAPFGNQGELRIKGNLIVDGSMTTINSTQVDISDTILTLNSNLASVDHRIDAGFEVKRDDIDSSTNVSFLWKEGNGTIDTVTDISGEGYWGILQPFRIEKQDGINTYLYVEGATTFRGLLDVSDSVTLRNTLDVQNSVTLRGTILDIAGHTTIRNGLDVRDNVTLQSVLDVGDNVTLRGSILDITGHTTVRNGLDVTDNVTLQSVLDVGDSVTLRGSILDISGHTTIRNGLDVTDNVTLQSVLNVGDNVTLRGTMLDINGHTTIRNGLDVRDNVTLQSLLDVGDSVTLRGPILDITGHTTIRNGLDVRDNVTLQSVLNVGNNVTLRGTMLDITGHTTIRNGLDVKDNVTLQSVLDVGDSVTLRGTILDIAGHTTIRNGLDVRDNVTLQSVLDVGDSVTLRGSILDIAGHTTIRNGLDVTDNVTLQSVLDVGDSVTLRGSILDITGHTTIRNGLDVKDNVTLQSILDVGNSVTLRGNILDITGHTSIRNGLDVKDNVTLQSVLNVGDSVTLRGTMLDITGHTTIRNGLDVTDNVTLQSVLDVGDNVTLRGSILDISGHTTIRNGLDVTDNVTLQSVLDVGDSVTLRGNILDISGHTTIRNGLDVTDNVTLQSVLDVGDSVTLRGNILDISGHTTIRNGLDVTDNVTLQSVLNVGDNVTLRGNILDITGHTTIRNGLDVKDNVTLQSVLNVGDSVTLRGTMLDITGHTTIRNGLDVTDNVTLQSVLDVGDSVTLRGTILDITGHTTIRNGLDVRDNVTLQSVLDVGDSVTLRGSILDINGHTTIRNGLDVRDNVTLQSVLDVGNSVTLRGSILDIEGYTTIRQGLHVEDHIYVKNYIAFGDISGDIDSDTKGGTIHSVGASTMVIDPAPKGDSGTLIIKGNLQLDGSMTTVNSSQVDISDTIITLGKGIANINTIVSTTGVGIEVGDINKHLLYKYSIDENLREGAENNEYMWTISNEDFHTEGVVNSAKLNIKESTTLRGTDTTIISTDTTITSSTLNISNTDLSMVGTSYDLTYSNTQMNVTDLSMTGTNYGLSYTSTEMTLSDLSMIGTNYDLSYTSTEMSLTDLSMTGTNYDLVYTNTTIQSQVDLVNDNSFHVMEYDNSNNGANVDYDTKTSEWDNKILNYKQIRQSNYINKAQQSFMELITLKPYKFESFTQTTTTSLLDLSWSMNNLYPIDPNKRYLNLLAGTSGNQENSLRLLPIIDNIIIEAQLPGEEWYNVINLTGDNVHINNTVSNNYINNINFSKTHMQSSLNNTTKDLADFSFNLRIHGDNKSIGDKWYVYIYDVSFLSAYPPDNSNNNMQLTLTNNILSNVPWSINNYIIEEFIDNNTTELKINYYDISISSLNDTLAANDFSNNYNIHEPDISNTSSISKGTTLTNNDVSESLELYNGTRYNYQYRLSNDGKNQNTVNFDDYSEITTSIYTPLPNNPTSYNKITNVNHITSESTKNIINQTLVENGVVYIYNNILPLNTSTRTYNLHRNNISISDSQGVNERHGFGKFIDNSLCIDISLNYYSDNTVASITKYHNIKVNGYNENPSDNKSFTNDIFNNESVSDPLSGIIGKEGFYKDLTFNLNNININDDLTRNNKIQKLEFVIRQLNSSSTLSESSYEFNFVVDDSPTLSPSITINDFSVNNITYAYNCGIPSVIDFDISYSYTLTGMNSQYMWALRSGNTSNADFGNITSIQYNNSLQNTSGNNNHVLNTSLNTNGTYNFNHLLQDVYFTNTKTTTTSENFTINYQLKTIQGTANSNIINNPSVNLFSDRNSFNESGGKITTSNKVAFYILDTSKNINFIDDSFNVADLSNMTLYNDDTTLVNKDVLIYFNGLYDDVGNPENHPVYDTGEYNSSRTYIVFKSEYTRSNTSGRTDYQTKITNEYNTLKNKIKNHQDMVHLIYYIDTNGVLQIGVIEDIVSNPIGLTKNISANALWYNSSTNQAFNGINSVFNLTNTIQDSNGGNRKIGGVLENSIIKTPLLNGTTFSNTTPVYFIFTRNSKINN